MQEKTLLLQMEEVMETSTYRHGAPTPMNGGREQKL